MEATNYAIIALSWVGIVAFSVLGAGTAYIWGMLLWEKIINHLSWPIGLFRVTRAAIRLSITKDPEGYAAGLIAKEIVEAEKRSPGFIHSVKYGIEVRENQPTFPPI